MEAFDCTGAADAGRVEVVSAAADPTGKLGVYHALLQCGARTWGPHDCLPGLQGTQWHCCCHLQACSLPPMLSEDNCAFPVNATDHRT